MTPWGRSIEMPVALVVEAGAIEDLPAIIDRASIDRRRPLIVGGNGPTRVYLDQVAGLMGSRAITSSCNSGTVAESARLASDAISEEVTTIVAVGGGTVVDVSKFAAARTGVPFVSVPTAIANDGISSPVASLWDKRGDRVSFGARMPAAVIVDLDVISRAPEYLTAAGVGDLASNLVAIADWRLADDRGHDQYDEFAALIGEAAAQMIWDLPTLDAQRRAGQLARGLLLSGVAMATAGTTRPCSGGEHLISHALDALLGRRAHPHGVQVALGTLMLAGLHGIDVDKLRSVFQACGLPLSLRDVGIDLETMIKAVELAPAMRPGRFTIVSELADRGLSVADLIQQTIG